MTRNGGFLFAIPSGFLDENVLLDAFSSEVENVLGPSREFSSDLCEEDDDANPVFLGRKVEVLVVDLSDEALGDCSEYDPVTHDFTSCAAFDADRPVALPLLTDILQEVRSWLQSATDDRSLFYSAQEDQEPATPAKATTSKKPPPAKKVTNQAIMEHLAMLGSQMQALAAQQEELRSVAFKAPSATPVPGPAKLMPITSKVPAVSSSFPAPSGTTSAVAKLLGPPPKTKAIVASAAEEGMENGGAPADPAGESPEPNTIVKAISQQSQALTALVAHLAGGDPLSELQLGGGASAGVSLSSKGVARRERMQQDLALRRSTYFLQVQQQLFRRMHPSMPVPQTEEELIASGATMTSYLEKQGGYKHQRDQALPMWIAAHAMDSAMMGDIHGCKEFLAILVTCMEQASHDGNWSVAYLLSLLEMPPSTIFSERIQHIHSLERPFSPLVPQPWAACALAYLKEIDVLTNKKAELKTAKAPAKAAAAASTEDPSPSPSPRRRPKFPKVPKGSPTDPKGA